jgi:protoheme IX farnesyltransferase
MTTPALPLVRPSLADWMELTKPRITSMVVFTALVGFVTASSSSPWSPLLAAALVGTGLVAAGASVLNQVLERDTDALMLRTRARPLPAGRVAPAAARAFGAVLTAAGLAALLWRSGPLAAAVAFTTWASYLFLYTPLKRKTPLATLVGAVPGALPPVIGWAAARGQHDAPVGVALLPADEPPPGEQEERRPRVEQGVERGEVADGHRRAASSSDDRAGR